MGVDLPAGVDPPAEGEVRRAPEVWCEGAGLLAVILLESFRLPASLVPGEPIDLPAGFGSSWPPLPAPAEFCGAPAVPGLPGLLKRGSLRDSVGLLKTIGLSASPAAPGFTGGPLLAGPGVRLGVPGFPGSPVSPGGPELAGVPVSADASVPLGCTVSGLTESGFTLSGLAVSVGLPGLSDLAAVRRGEIGRSPFAPGTALV